MRIAVHCHPKGMTLEQFEEVIVGSTPLASRRHGSDPPFQPQQRPRSLGLERQLHARRHDRRESGGERSAKRSAAWFRHADPTR